jgi:hypothetical protein
MRLMRAVVPVLVAIATLLLVPLESSAQTSAENTWAGTWKSDFGTLTLSASGSGAYEGYYPGTISGTITGNVLEGTWTQPTNDPPKSGTFKFTMSADGHSFTGDWAYAGGGCGIACGWNGTCIDGPCTANGAGSTPTPSVSVTLSVKAPDGQFGSSARVDVGTAVQLKVVVSPLLPTGATVTVSPIGKSCSTSLCVLSSRSKRPVAAQFQALVLSANTVLAKSPIVRVVWSRSKSKSCRKLSSVGAAPGCLKLSYRMPARFGKKAGNTYVIESELTASSKPQDITPVTWRVEISVEACPKAARYTWTVNGKRATADRESVCTFWLEFPKEDTYHVAVTARLLDGSGHEEAGSLSVKVQDWLIVGIGDSLASGEGAPVRGEFLNNQCDLSGNSWQSQVALGLQYKIPDAEKTSVTFVHLACSGASIRNGLLGRYGGMTQEGFLPPQLDVMKKLIGNREVDAVLLSIGVNEFRFGEIAAFCARNEICQNRPFPDARFPDTPNLLLRDFINAVFDVRVSANPDHRALDFWFGQVNQRLLDMHVDPKRVYITEYPDFLEAGKCEALSDATWFPGIKFDTGESAFLYTNLLVPLNQRISGFAAQYGWNVVRTQNEFTQHGYCDGIDPWITTIAESRARQENDNGALHPNRIGHAQIASWALPMVSK